MDPGSDWADRNQNLQKKNRVQIRPSKKKYSEQVLQPKMDPIRLKKAIFMKIVEEKKDKDLADKKSKYTNNFELFSLKTRVVLSLLYFHEVLHRYIKWTRLFGHALYI